MPAAESVHLCRSLRARQGDAIRAFDGMGRTWNGVVLHPDAGGLVMRIDVARVHKAPVPELALAQVLPKAGGMDEIIRAAVELGAAQIQPLFSERCEVKLDDGRVAARLVRWRTVAIEACKQSGNPFLPRIHEPRPLEAWLAAPTGRVLRFVGSLEAGAEPLALFKPAPECPDQLSLLVGPEGDFSPGEYALVRRYGLHAVRFGKNILRVPTAALYALVALDQLRQREWPGQLPAWTA